MKKVLTLDQLIKVCEEKHLFSYSSKETDSQLHVYVNADSELTFNTDDTTLLYLKVKVCHTELNRNKSYISEETMKNALPSLKYKPFLAHIIEDENGELDFDSHNIDIIEDKDGNEKYVYIERQVGTFTADEPVLEYDEKMDKTYVVAYVAIPEEYTEAANIIRRKNGTKVSCELLINEMHYDAKNKYLVLDDILFSGCTALGESVGEGMLGSRADITDFMFDEEKYDAIPLEKNKVVNEAIHFNIDSDLREGGSMNMDKDNVFEEVEETEEVEIAEDVNEENIDIETEEKEEVEETELDEIENVDNFESQPVEDKALVKEFKDENLTMTFRISDEDIRCAIYRLLEAFEAENNCCLFIEAVYDGDFIVKDWCTGSLYGCKFSKNGDSISLDGSLYPVYQEYLTEEEYNSLNAMRSNYSIVCESLAKYQKAEEKALKDSIFADDSYSEYLETEEFKELINNAESYTVDELQKEVDLAFAKIIKKSKTFNYKGNDEKSSNKRVVRSAKEVKGEKKPYGDLFDN